MSRVLWVCKWWWVCQGADFPECAEEMRFVKNIARIAKAALHNLPGKSSWWITHSVGPICRYIAARAAKNCVTADFDSYLWRVLWYLIVMKDTVEQCNQLLLNKRRMRIARSIGFFCGKWKNARPAWSVALVVVQGCQLMSVMLFLPCDQVHHPPLDFI